jgi:hypothetical protein
MACRIAEHTGLPQNALVTYVLTGLEPVRSRAQLTMRETGTHSRAGNRSLGVNDVMVTFRARDLTDKELRTIPCPYAP